MKPPSILTSLSREFKSTTDMLSLMRKSIPYSLIFAGATSLLFGCAIGNAPHENPPKLIGTVFQEGWNGSKFENVAWDRPGAFGPVPEGLRVTGDTFCQKGGFERAIGYHPNALDLEGQNIPSGGFYCSNSKE
ncbi:MAG TPA: hypothetical protein VN226_02285 [Anaerolineales bacterium]|nr:hypothetical protein [Anaerolineales bacterium]